MTRIADLGTVMQLAYVTDDMELSTRYWTQTMGVGPFFKLENSHLGADHFHYRGIPCEAVYDVRIAYWGEMQIELIQQRNEAPSIYTDWRSGAGLHHTCILVDDMDEALRVCMENSAPLLQDGKFGSSRFAYVDTGGGPGSILELLAAPDEVHERYVKFRDAARNWHGDNPVRNWLDV